MHIAKELVPFTMGVWGRKNVQKRGRRRRRRKKLAMASKLVV
jgi:hypothetical protein